MSSPFARLAMLLLGVAAALCGAGAVVIFALWILDQSPMAAALHELVAALVLAVACGACAIGRRLLQRHAVRTERAGHAGGSL